MAAWVQHRKDAEEATRKANEAMNAPEEPDDPDQPIRMPDFKSPPEADR